MGVVVIGQIGRDLVMRVDELPAAGGTASGGERREMMGGKGANQAVGRAQLGVPTALIGVVGEDIQGAALLRQATRDGIDVSCVARRGPTALLLDVVDGEATRLLVEDVPDTSRWSRSTTWTAARRCSAPPTWSASSPSSRRPRCSPRRATRPGWAPG